MLDGATLPIVPGSGQGGAGEILPLYPLFAEFSRQFDLDVKERGSLINGSPCAAAMLGIPFSVARGRVQLAEQVLAYRSKRSARRWSTTTRRSKRCGATIMRLHPSAPCDSSCLQTGKAAGDYQAPVSYRIVPRLLGQAHRALAAAERAAAISLRSVSDNPTYLPPSEGHPLGRCISTGWIPQFHGGAGAGRSRRRSADLCLLCHRHATRLLDGRASKLPDLLMINRDPCESDGHGSVGYIPMAMTGYLEQARTWAQRTLLPGTEKCGVRAG